jgi:hypothetical protein
LKGNKGTTHDTGLLSGGMEAWKLKSLLLQLFLSIGEMGHIVPNKAEWFQQKTGLPKHFFVANITEVIIAASCTALEFAVMLRAKSTTHEHIQCLDYMEQVTHYHHIRLQILKRILFHKMKTGLTVVPNVSEIKSGNKEHYFFHYKEAIKRLGPDVRLWDTEHSEKLHQATVKEAHRRSSKRFDGKQMSMALKYKEVQVITKYKKMVTSSLVPDTKEDVKGDVRVFEAADTFSSNSLMFDTKTKMWKVSTEDQLLYYHPLLTPQLLDKQIRTLQQRYKVQYPGVFEFHLMEKLKVNEPEGTEDWMLRCTQHHNRNYHMEGDGMADYVSIWNAVSCNIEDVEGEIETRICLVLAIVYMEISMDEAEHNIAATFVIVAPMEDSGVEMQIPYEHLKLCMDGSNEVVVECLNAKQRVVDPVFISTTVPFPQSDYDTDFYDIPFWQLNFVVVPHDRMSFPSQSLNSPAEYMLQFPKIYVSYEFLKSEQTRLLLDYDECLPHVDADDENDDFVDMIESDSESVHDEDFTI